MSTETIYEPREPQWLQERPKEHRSHFDQRGCVREIKQSGTHPRTTAVRHSENSDLSKSRSRRGNSFPEQSPVTSEQPPALTYSANPSVTPRTASDTSFIYVPIVEFMVPLCCKKCEEKVKEELENDEGVYKVVCDLYNQRVTVSSNRDPNWLLQRIKRTKKNSHFWRSSTRFKGARYVTSLTTRGQFPSSKSSHLIHEPSQHGDTLDYPDSAPQHHRASTRRQSQKYFLEPEESGPRYHSASSHRESRRRFVAAPGSPYGIDDGHDDDVETPYLTRNRGDGEYYYHYDYPQGADLQYQYKRSSPTYETSTYDARMYDDAASEAPPFRDSSLRRGHLPSSYGHSYAPEDYSLTGYY